MKIPGVILAVMLVAWSGASRATDIEEVTSAKGVKAWLVEDHKLPLIAMNFAFRGGVEQDPVGKQGLATLAMSLLTQGAGPYDASAFQQQMADHGIVLHFAAGRDQLEGGLKTLVEERETAFDLLRVALTHPRFDPAEIERARARQLTRIRFQMGDPDWQARYALLNYIFAGHPYGERSLGTLKTLAGLTADDIGKFAATRLARGNLIVAVAGDITPKDLEIALDKVFGDLPIDASLAEIPEAKWPKMPASILVPREGTQTDLLFAEPGPKRDDPDWYAAQIANYILGGGGFSSRLMQEVRVKNGLTYGIDTGLAPMKHAAMITGDAATDNPKTGDAWNITQDVWRKFHQDGATPEEIKSAKDYLTGSLPLTLTSTDAIAETLVELQFEKLGRDYLEKREQIIGGVSDGAIKAAIGKWFDPANVSVAMVGEPKGVKPSTTQEQVRE